MRAALIATVLVASVASMSANADPPTTTTDAPAHDAPLVAYAQELGQPESSSGIKELHIATTNLRARTAEMSRHPPPPDEECAHTLGASRFAQQYAQLARIQDELGNFEASIEANRSALACTPRVAVYEVAIASGYLNLGRIAEARAAAERGYAIDAEDRGVRDVRAQLDFIQEHWADATARFRLQVLERTLPEDADYSRCYLWLSQRRAGVRNPDMPLREPDPASTTTREKRWPAPILDTLRGERSEADLVEVIRESGPTVAREWLTEALFYVGERKLAEGDAEAARRHFASAVNLKVLNFVEYGMSRAELDKMREHQVAEDAATSRTGARAR
jgi:tetratricopeptide (TPR) repeat protein